MSEETQETPVVFNVMVENTPGSETWVLREPFTGTKDEVTSYAEGIAAAEGHRIKVCDAAGVEVALLDPPKPDSGDA